LTSSPALKGGVSRAKTGTVLIWKWTAWIMAQRLLKAGMVENYGSA